MPRWAHGTRPRSKIWCTLYSPAAASSRGRFLVSDSSPGTKRRTGDEAHGLVSRAVDCAGRRMRMLQTEGRLVVSGPGFWGHRGDHTQCMQRDNPHVAAQALTQLDRTDQRKRLIPRPGDQESPVKSGHPDGPTSQEAAPGTCHIRARTGSIDSSLRSLTGPVADSVRGQVRPSLHARVRLVVPQLGHLESASRQGKREHKDVLACIRYL